MTRLPVSTRAARPAVDEPTDLNPSLRSVGPPSTLADPELLKFLRGYIGMMITDFDTSPDGHVILKLHPPGRRGTRWLGLWSPRPIVGMEIREGSRLLKQCEAAQQRRMEGRT